MEKTEFKKYTKEEKEQLLLHWWRYYGKEIYTLAEEEQLIDLINENPEIIFQTAVLSFIDDKGTKPLLMAIRKNKINGLKQEVQEKLENPLLKSQIKDIERIFLEEIVTTYNQPKPIIPMEKKNIKHQFQSLKEDRVVEKKLNSTRVSEIFKSCIFKDEEIKDNRPTSEYTIATGVLATVVFHTKRLNENKAQINEMVNQIKNIEQGPHFLDLCIDKTDRLWTGDHSVVEQLMTLGFATELLEVPLNLPREMWNIFPEGLPYVIKNDKKVDIPVIGNDPSKFPAQKKKS